MSKEYFNNTKAISHSQLKTFVKYNKYGQRQLYPDLYKSRYIDKTTKFEPTDVVIIGKIVDRYFDGEGINVWNYYIPVARRSGKELERVREGLLEDIKNEKINIVVNNFVENGKALVSAKFDGLKYTEDLEGIGKDIEEATNNLINTHVSENYLEITNGMKDTAENMIVNGLAFSRFNDFINKEGTEAQVHLDTNFTFTDKITGELVDVNLKGLPDFVNEEEKIVMDLKTTGNIDMIIDELQFRGEPKMTANYIRQLSMYNKQLGGGYDGVLGLISDDGFKWIFIPNSILEEAWELLERDIVELQKYLNNPEDINDSIFIKPDEDITDLDDLTL